MLIEIHMIQNHSPANMNRDDLGAPKTCIFGGVTRARISSQCLKRSIRNPGNPDNVHSRGPGLFATAMGEHVGIRTKLFPWLVKQELTKTNIPEEEHDRIVMSAQRIATAKEKEQRKSKGDAADNRPKTPQLISLGYGDAKQFVAKLIELRGSDNGTSKMRECYNYFLNPRVGFEEMVRGYLDERDLDTKTVDKLVKASWTIAKCRMAQLLKSVKGEEGDEGEEIDEGPVQESATDSQGQPGEADARRIADALTELSLSEDKGNKDRLKKLTENASNDERNRIKEDAPAKPEKMDAFVSELKKTLTCRAVDVALFGRMTTSDYFEDVEAAMQVAHAISTHAAVNEVDYFTAVDDLGKGPGAGHVDEAMLNSACFYKYFCLDWDQLVHNLAGPKPKKPEAKKADTKQWEKDSLAWEKEVLPNATNLAACTLGHFLRAAARTAPSGKQNSCASHCEPCGILVEIKKNGKIPTSYANAFAEPVERLGKPDDDAADYVSLIGRSVAQLGDHVYNVRKAYGIDSKVLWYAMPLWRYPLQGWERDADGRKAKVLDKKGEPTDRDKPPVQFADKSFDVLGGKDGKPEGLIEALLSEVGFEWSKIRDAGKA